MGFEAFLNRGVFGRKVSGQAAQVSALHPAVVAELQRLDLYRRGLGAEATRFVATGEPAMLLDTIGALAKATPYHTAPYHKDSTAKYNGYAATNRALITGEIPAGPAIGRLIDTRLAAENEARWNLGSLPERQAQRIHALWGMLNSGLSSVRVNYAVDWSMVIPLAQVLKLVIGTGGNVAELFAFLMRQNGEQDSANKGWQRCEEFGALGRTYPVAFGMAIKTVASPKAFEMAKLHGLDALPEVVAAMVEMLTKPFSKAQSEFAASALARLDAEVLAGVVAEALPGADIDARVRLVQAAGRNATPEMLTLLAERAKVEKAARVKAALDAVLETAQGEPVTDSDVPGYLAIDGIFVAIPPVIVIPDGPVPPPSADDRRTYDTFVAEIAAERAVEYAKSTSEYSRKHLEPFPQDAIEAAFRLITEAVPCASNRIWGITVGLRMHPDRAKWCQAMFARMPLAPGLRSLFGYGYNEIEKLFSVDPSVRDRWSYDLLRAGLVEGRFGLRELVALDAQVKRDRSGAPDPDGVRYSSISHLSLNLGQQSCWDRQVWETGLSTLPSQAVWPLLAENLDLFDEAFGLKPTSRSFGLDRMMTLLALLPAVPQRYLPALVEIAVTEKKPLRKQARALLRAATDLDMRIVGLLDDKRQGVRVNAAAWLADMRAERAVPAMRKRLAKEKSDPVRTALIEALQRLGADLSDIVGPATLIAEAEAALAKTPAALPDWLKVDAMPALHFRDGHTAPPTLLRHWLSLAIRLKDPTATGQFGIYLDQLDLADPQKLSNWVLEAWIAYDTAAASLDDANAYALANYTQDWRWQYRTQTPELRDSIIAEIRRTKLGELINSGSDTKGLLALACRADPARAAERVRWFLKKHGRRSNQAMALLDVLVGIDHPATLQVVIAASVRLKQKSTQARAAELAQRYAEDRGWTFDELADRTVPTAGFDDDGVLDLPCGPDAKPYAARLDAALAIHLFNPDGKPIKSLPAGDDDMTRDSAKALSAAKKELKQIVELQASRLFEAMCVERSWPVAEWRSAFHEHPVMRRLIERLVWQGLDAEGQPQALFRPTQEGDFTDATDGAVAIESFDRVRLAHGTLVDEAACAAWVAHLKDYAVVPVLAQFDAVRSPLTDAMRDATEIVDRLGWVAPSLTYRGIVEPRSYVRVMGDGGGCNEYVKTFAGVGIAATIHHSGSHAVDENNPVALKELTFERVGRRGGALPLSAVPPVLLAECWADYHAAAAKGAFNAEWEKVCPW